MEKSKKQQQIEKRRKMVRSDYDAAVNNKASITETVNVLAFRFSVTPITIYQDIKKTKPNA
jgi:hypothetical protein